MLKVVIADNQAIFRTGTAKVLAVEDDVRIVAQAQDYEQLAMAMNRFRPAIALVAAGLVSNLDQLVDAGRGSGTHVVLIAENTEDAAGYMARGAHSVVFRNISAPVLVECIRKVAGGERWVQDAHAAEAAAETDMVGARVRDRLTPKELRIIALIVQGYKNKDIASRLGTTEQVIKNYLRNVYDKIGVSDRLELALFTIHHRILAEAAAAEESSGAEAPRKSARAARS
jgi:DNA-binding NarL/FixJ family response regulator